MNNRTITYIDTDITGLVVQIAHNFNDTVYPFLFEPDESGHEKAVSLYSPVLAEVKSLDKNIFQISFTGTWKGFVHLVKLNVSGTQYAARLESLESKIVLIQEQIEKLTNGAQWRQMNTYILSEVDKLRKELGDVSLAQDVLRKEISEF
jgi:hypothetical protein